MDLQRLSVVLHTVNELVRLGSGVVFLRERARDQRAERAESGIVRAECIAVLCRACLL